MKVYGMFKNSHLHQVCTSSQIPHMITCKFSPTIMGYTGDSKTILVFASYSILDSMNMKSTHVTTCFCAEKDYFPSSEIREGSDRF